MLQQRKCIKYSNNSIVLIRISLNENTLFYDAYLIFLVGLSDPVHFSRFVSIALAYKLRSRWGGFAISQNQLRNVSYVCNRKRDEQ